MRQQPGSRDDWASWDGPTRPLNPQRPQPPRPQPIPYTVPAPPRPDYGPPPPLPRVTTPRPQRWPPSAPPRWNWGRVLRIGALVALVVVVLLTVLGIHRLYDFGAAISTQGPLTSQTGLMNGTDRVNLLVMGYGGTGHDGANLTDSLMVVSVVPGDSATTMISVPRDLWVQVPPNSGSYGKINTAYQDGLSNGFGGVAAGKIAGGNEAAQKVSDVLGIKINYWLTIDFSGFRDLVNSVGGVDINVPTAFTAQYPANDDPAIDASWKTITFKKGEQHMNGEQAIEYARARYILNPVSEGTDFARSARQQLLINALIARLHSPGSWPGFISGTNALQQTIYTNLSLLDLGLFARKMDMKNAARIGLSNENVLVDGQSGDGQDILQPANGNWGAVTSYVASHLKN